MAVYSQQPTFSGAPWFPGVHSAWWRPKRTADKSSAAPCVALHLYSDPVGCYAASRANHGCIKLCVGLGCLVACAFSACCGACSHRGRMAVYSQQPTFSGAPWFPGVHSAWWRPKRTADKSSAAPCVALHLYSDPVGCYVASRANHGCIKLCVGLGCVLRGVHLVACAFSACCGACSHRGRMAVYSQQPTFSGAPWLPGVHSAWWRPKRTADKSSAAPCVALHLYS